jgi:hypothetical protein
VPKTLAKPNWASVGELIGYTFGLKITPEMVEEIRAQARRDLNSRWRWGAKPSVYYKQGHVTLQHKGLENLGYTNSARWRWLYFGNVPEAEAKKPHHQEQNQGDRRQPRIQFADRIRRQYGSYCWGDGVNTEWNLMGDPARGWKTNRSSKLPKDAVLLEIWVRQDVNHAFGPATVVSDSVMDAHPSRNRFHWVADDYDLKKALHVLATEWMQLVDSSAAEMTVGKPKKWQQK